MPGFRLKDGGLIDRSQTIGFTFNGKKYTGFKGDTVASALVASGISIFGRSFKYHRPRGLFSRGAAEPNALMQLGAGAKSTPNVPATQIPLIEGLEVKSINAWPSVNFDIGEINDVFRHFLIAGFYYKTMMWPSWHVFEPIIRRAAGMGTVSSKVDPDTNEARSLHCGVLVVGAGISGLHAALEAAKSGTDVVIMDSELQPGGLLLWSKKNSNEQHGLQAVLAELRSFTNVKIMCATTVLSYHDNNYLLAVERCDEMSVVDERLWRIRADAVVAAQGALERPIIFENNDRPGVIAADAFLELVHRYGVGFGKKVVFFVNGNRGDEAIEAAREAGIEIAAIVNSNTTNSPLTASSDELFSGYVVQKAFGRKRVKGAEISKSDGSDSTRIDCDTIVVAGGSAPQLQLYTQSGSSLKYNSQSAAFLPALARQNIYACGACNGMDKLDSAIEDGLLAGRNAVASISSNAVDDKVIVDKTLTDETLTDNHLIGKIAAEKNNETQAPCWYVKSSDPKTSFVDMQGDVTVSDLSLSLKENFRSIEHIKRYTTLGMGVEQGKLSGLSAIGIIGELCGKSPGEVGTIKHRPPYSPVSFATLTAGVKQGALYAPIKQLPAHSWHEEQGAFFEDHGWMRPTYYTLTGETMHSAAKREVEAVRSGVGLFDGSPLGKFEIKGPDAATFLEYIYAGRIKTLKVGRIRYGIMLNENGALFDDGVVVRIAEDHFVLNTSSGHAEAVSEWLEAWHQLEWPLELVIQDCTAQWAVATLVGPKARLVLEAMSIDFDVSKENFPHMSFKEGFISGIPVRVQRVSFSGEIGFEINIAADYAHWIMGYITEHGKPFGLAPYGIEALEILRTEKGYIHVGTDTESDTQPKDIGFPVPSKLKASDFIGRRSLMRPDSLRANRKQLVGIQTTQPNTPLDVGSHIIEETTKNSIGFITSSYHSPTLNRTIALALLEGGRERMGEPIKIWSLGKTTDGIVCSTSFVDPEGEFLNA